MAIAHGLVQLTLLSLLVGCSVSDRIVYEDAEGRVDKTFFHSVLAHKTEQSWVLDNLGQPHTIQASPDGHTFYNYRFQKARYREVRLLLLLSFQGSEQHERYWHVSFCQGYVDKHWWDSLAKVQLGTHQSASCTAMDEK